MPLPTERTDEGFFFGKIGTINTKTGIFSSSSGLDYSYIYDVGAEPPAVSNFEGSMSGITGVEEMTRMMQDAMHLAHQTPPDLINAMELYSSSLRLSDHKSRFVLVMSALESICIQRNWKKDEDYGGQVADLIGKMVETVKAADDLSGHIRNSLINNLRGNVWRESVSQSIQETIRQYLPEPGPTVSEFKRIYTIRSKMLHGGKISSNITDDVEWLENMFRKLIACKVRLPLRDGGRIEWVENEITLDDWYPPKCRIRE